MKIIDRVKPMCPDGSFVLFENESITVFLSQDIGISEREVLKFRIVSFISSNRLHESVRNVHIKW